MKKAFTLIEIFIVIGIIAILSAIAIPKLIRMRRIEQHLITIKSNMTLREFMRDRKKYNEFIEQFNEIKKVEKSIREKIKSSDFESDSKGW